MSTVQLPTTSTLFKQQLNSLLDSGLIGSSLVRSAIISIVAALVLALHTQYSVANNSEPDAKFILELSTEAEDAIDNGVALTFDATFAKPDKVLLWTVHLDKKVRPFILQRHALSNRYIVKSTNDEAPHIFRSITESLDFIATEALLLLESYNHGEWQMSMQINKYKLPSPMRLKAFLSNDWDIDSRWIVWASAH